MSWTTLISPTTRCPTQLLLESSAALLTGSANRHSAWVSAGAATIEREWQPERRQQLTGLDQPDEFVPQHSLEAVLVALDHLEVRAADP